MHKRLNVLLAYEGISLYQLAEKVNAAYSSVTKWSNGSVKPNVDNLQKLAEMTPVNLHWLITGKGEMFINE